MIQITNKICQKNINEIYNISCEQFKEETWNQNQLAESFKSTSTKFLALKIKNEIISFLVYQDLIDSINILLIATKEKYKNHGYAKKLINFLKKVENRKIWLEVKETNYVAISFYTKCGFQPIYTRKKYYKNGENAIIFETNN